MMVRMHSSDVIFWDICDKGILSYASGYRCENLKLGYGMESCDFLFCDTMWEINSKYAVDWSDWKNVKKFKGKGELCKGNMVYEMISRVNCIIL